MDRSKPIILSADLSELASGGADNRRERAATALESGLAFVEANGSELSKLRAGVVVQTSEGGVALEALAAEQREDGSFDCGADRCFPPVADAGVGLGTDSVSAALEALTIFGSLRGLHAPTIDASVNFLSQAQQEDGSFRVDGGAHADCEVFVTTMVGGFLGRTRSVRPHVLSRAAGYVETQWAPERVEGGSWAALAGFAHFFTNVHHDLADEALQWCGRELERGFRTRAFDAVATLRVMQYCDADALPGLQIETEELLDLLLSEQGEDGGFSTNCLGAESMGKTRVAATLESMRSIISLCANLAD